MHSAHISKLACPFLSTERHTKKKYRGGRTAQDSPTGELLERIPLDSSVISGLRQDVLITRQLQKNDVNLKKETILTFSVLARE